MSKFSKEILVTGGSGFLGSYVADVLSDAGLKVTIFDIKKSPWIKKPGWPPTPVTSITSGRPRR